MNISIFDSNDELSMEAAEIIMQEIKLKSNLLLCAATGSSPTKTYRLLVEEYRKNSVLFERLRIAKLDEWGGIPIDNAGTCESYLRKNLLNHLQISDERYFGFTSESEDPKKECERVQQKLKEEGPIDLCVLGLGLNGHLALNEPASFLQPFCHIEELSESSKNHKMTGVMQRKPEYGLTLGIADILNSKKILMLINGEHKKSIAHDFLAGKVTPEIPSSFLWLHPNVECLIERVAFT